ncbi:alternative ribosome rescue aminoacyl-tRNA hydrolase ArfB [Mongoliitalea daihaiensis]|uniref:alternative ribosome rescue aminoacyl-tRNA hydrolase ArfB n=1 Tax=Mongoliitalea daihaiensis TaxID=2782006 RepID=UPI001F2D61AC|nr:alternative ribosome rescue aminoacyl-tRNA hydrolase ArfB [Mongoliitalea daihaiensis]UJP64151.1 aminoacyl-tRNA hydrolase [Mongoliitalea daihaiensis]
MHIQQKIKQRLFDPEFEFIMSRSSGPGGQNVNKVNSKVQLKFNVLASQVLDLEEKEVLQKKWSSKLDISGGIILQSQEKRSQLQNKDLVIRKFYELLTKAFEKKKKRIATKPSKAAVEERLKAKKARSEKKKWRSDY